MRPVVVLATDSQDPSGVGQHMLTLGMALGERFEIVVAAGNSDGGRALLQRAAAAGLRIIGFDLERPADFRHWLADHAHLLHVHAGIGWEGHELVRFGRAAGLPVVRTEHLPYLLTSPVQQAEYGAMLLSADRVITVSRPAYDSFVARHPARLYALVPNGIVAPSATRTRDETRASLGLLVHERVLLTVARFTPQKDYPTLLDAVALIRKQHPGARFVWVGDGPDLQAISERIAAEGLQDAVMLLGRRDDVGDLLAAADLFVLPSRFEGLPLALLEAMASGLPAAAAINGGTMEAVGERHPFLAAPGDPEALAAIIVAALGDPQAAEAARKASLARFEHSFRASRMATQTAEIYAGLLPAPSFIAQVRSA